MDIRSLDLNLLVAFDAMLKHQNVTKAAEAIKLSQPAMSAALSRLRALFDDPLFVRTGAGMVPTPKAQALSPMPEPLRWPAEAVPARGAGIGVGPLRHDVVMRQQHPVEGGQHRVLGDDGDILLAVVAGWGASAAFRLVRA